jgi:lipopolysaccharide transport system ATP-binding protein
MSSSEIAVSVRGLSKAYTIAHSAPQHTTLGEALIHRLKHPTRRVQKETFWALRDIDFDVARGDVVGIIGRNGAGKSTLLKILSRITEPTAGQIDLYGRLGSLLEVGTGFHPELTGRENIYLNGAILGMKRAEIDRHFDAIVDFAGVEQFLDTPVKRYSSGMYVRLAFAVAAHLDLEIMVVDEVLAVGDAEFQKKCLGKMKDVASGGRTVLFVSHNMDAVRNLCSRGLLLRQGELICDDSVERCIQEYTSGSGDYRQAQWLRGPDRGDHSLVIQSVSAELLGEQPRHTLNVDVELESVSAHKPAFIAIDILNAAGTALMQSLPEVEGFMADTRATHRVQLAISLPPMIPGQYMLTIWVGSHNSETLDHIKECVGFEVCESPVQSRTYPHTPDHGYIVAPTRLEYRGEGKSREEGRGKREEKMQMPEQQRIGLL